MKPSIKSVSPVLRNHGFHGVCHNQLETDEENLNHLVRFFNKELSATVNRGKKIECDPADWIITNWYHQNMCNEQLNTSRMETYLAMKGVEYDKFPVFFRTGNISALLYPLVLYPTYNYKQPFDTDSTTEFKFDAETGLRFICPRYQTPNNLVQQAIYDGVDHFKRKASREDQGEIVEHLFTSEGDDEYLLDCGKERIFLINSLEFPGSDTIMFCSKKLDSFWDRNAPLNLENGCEIKAVNKCVGAKMSRLIIKTYALGGVRRVAKVETRGNKIIKVNVIPDLEKYDLDGCIGRFYDCLNNFINLVVATCRQNEIPSGKIDIYRNPFGRFLVITYGEYFWCFEYNFETKTFSEGLKFPKTLTAIRWPTSDYQPFNRNKVRDLDFYNFMAPPGSQARLCYPGGNCLLVVKRKALINFQLAKQFQFKVAMDDPIFTLLEKILLREYYTIVQ